MVINTQKQIQTNGANAKNLSSAESMDETAGQKNHKNFTYLWTSAAYLANITVMKLGLFWWWFGLHHAHRWLLLPSANLVFPTLSRRLRMVMLLVDKGCRSVVHCCLVSLSLVASCVSRRCTSVTRRVVRVCLPVCCCLGAGIGVRISHSRRLR